MNDAVVAKKPSKLIERVTVSDPLKGKLQSLCEQANAGLNGMATISKSDIVNLFLEMHNGLLSKEEIERLRVAHFDEVRFANWMASRLKEARSAGESISLMELVEQGKSLMAPPELSVARRTRKRKQQADDTTRAAPSQTEIES